MELNDEKDAAVRRAIAVAVPEWSRLPKPARVRSLAAFFAAIAREEQGQKSVPVKN